VKGTYDVIGAGEGIAGLFASVLLAARGLSCLWVDASPQRPGTTLPEDTPLLLTEAFYQEILVPVLSRVDKRLAGTLDVEHGLSADWVEAEDLAHERSCRAGTTPAAAGRGVSGYVPLLRRSLTRPGRYLRRLGGRHATRDVRGQDPCAASSPPGTGLAGRYRGEVSALGMCALAHGAVKTALESCLARARGRLVRSPGAAILTRDGAVLGMPLEDVVHVGHSYLTEDPPGETPHHGFYLYGRCRAPLDMLPPGMGDLLVIPPPVEMRSPLVLKVNRHTPDPSISIFTRAHAEEGLASFTEAVSWASGMVVKRVSRVLPFLAAAMQTFEAVNPLQGGTVRPWFRFSDDVRPPSLFGARRYISPLERMYALDRDKYACLGDDGDFFWGICIANAVLRDLGRSDLITAG